MAILPVSFISIEPLERIVSCLFFEEFRKIGMVVKAECKSNFFWRELRVHE